MTSGLKDNPAIFDPDEYRVPTTDAMTSGLKAHKRTLSCTRCDGSNH